MEVTDDYWDFAINLMKSNNENDDIKKPRDEIAANNGYPVENKLNNFSGKKFKTRLNEDNYVETSCKNCGMKFNISSKYDGGYPLCYKHRDPNERFMKKNNKK
tara:strand:+ start:127 stop:435 length:309 start_codon:yes stop_codon:yes gene_type:complete